MKKTNTPAVRKACKKLLKEASITFTGPYGAICHPFATNIIQRIDDTFVDLTRPKDYRHWVSFIRKTIDRMSAKKIYYLLVQPAYALTFVKIAQPYLSDADFAEILSNAWISQQRIHYDPDIPLEIVLKWFKRAQKRLLMSKEEMNVWERLPKEVVVYRGVGLKEQTYDISWTLSKDRAKFFQERFAIPGKSSESALLMAKVPKENCICYLNGKGEQEIIVDINAIRECVVVLNEASQSNE